MVDAKALKAATKEGGKKGVDACGMADLGGVKHFHINVETPEGDWELMTAVLEGMNAEVDESAEERKGGAGGLGKALLSAGKDALIVLVHVPAALAADKGLSAKEWAERLSGAVGGEVSTEGEEIAKITVKADPDNNKFPLKMRDEASGVGFAMLREKKLVPEPDSDDDFVCDPEAAGIGEW